MIEIDDTLYFCLILSTLAATFCGAAQIFLMYIYGEYPPPLSVILEDLLHYVRAFL